MSKINLTSYRVAGWLAMANAFLTIPWLIMTFFLTAKEGLWSRLADAGMQLLSAAIFIYTVFTLRTLLNRNYSFHDTDRLIEWMIKANVVLTGISLIGIVSPTIASSAGTLAIILIIPLGVLQLFFGLRLQQLPSDNAPLFRPYSYLNIVTGFCLATIIMIPLGVVVGAIADIMLGTILLQAASTDSNAVSDAA
jgi:hypothetical protein